jgi:NADH-quinone oxidoreductase subunit J
VAKWLGAPLIGALLVEMLVAVWDQFPSAPAVPPAHLDGSPTAIGQLLFGSYVLPFEVTSVLILVAVLGAVVLAKKEF